ASGHPAPASYLFDDQSCFVAHQASRLFSELDKRDACPTIVREHLQPIASRPRPRVVSGIAYLPVLPRCRLVIVGGGHVGKAGADLAAGPKLTIWFVGEKG